eukprot:scaffold189123_cov42-Prasinocladus_malaysianus.AAC.1
MAVPARSVGKTWKAEVDKLHSKDGAAFKNGNNCSVPRRNNLCGVVAAAGELNMLKWLLGTEAHKRPKYICDDAAGGGQVAMFQWTMWRSCPWIREGMKATAQCKLLE